MQVGSQEGGEIVNRDFRRRLSRPFGITKCGCVVSCCCTTQA